MRLQLHDGIVLGFFGLAFTACGGQLEEVTPTPAPPPRKLLQVAAEAGAFETLRAAISSADLEVGLSGPGPFTVFAPTDEAFAMLPAGTLDGLLADKAKLSRVLLHHVVAGNIGTTAAKHLDGAETMAGTELAFRSLGAGPLHVNGARVIMADIPASNGIIHAIDQVLIPEDPPATTQTIAEIAAANPDFSTLMAAVGAANLAETLAGPGPLTVFAPTNGAFSALPPGAVVALLADVPELQGVLGYHVLPGLLNAEQIAGMDHVTTLEGADLRIERRDGALYVNQARIVSSDIIASNGIIHVIDAVLAPPTIVDLAVASPELSTLVTAVTAADLAGTLSSPGPFTVFAPVNSAFAALPAGTLEAVLADIPTLTAILKFHVVPGRYLAADVLARSTLPTAQGAHLSITTHDGGRVNGARILRTDIIGKNGVVHLIDGVLLPPPH